MTTKMEFTNLKRWFKYKDKDGYINILENLDTAYVKDKENGIYVIIKEHYYEYIVSQETGCLSERLLKSSLAFLGILLEEADEIIFN